MPQEERLAEMQCRVDEADTLWSRLGTAAEDQQRLLALKTSPGASAAERADAELAALREQLQARLGDLVAALRERVGGLWEELNMTEAKGREEFPAFALGAGEFSDAVLTEHEQYVEMLEDRARRLRPILKVRRCAVCYGCPPNSSSSHAPAPPTPLQNIARREDLVAERVEYDKLVQDSSRLLSRRSGRACVALVTLCCPLARATSTLTPPLALPQHSGGGEDDAPGDQGAAQADRAAAARGADVGGGERRAVLQGCVRSTWQWVEWQY